MPIHFSPVIAAKLRGNSSFSVHAVDLAALRYIGLPVVVLDEFRVRGRPFTPHPHAGFSAVTYVFEDSPGSLRSRDSLGNDIVVGPGGIVWTQAGNGMLHHEVPADSDNELHGLQLFVNLSARNKFVAPRMLHLGRTEVPEWWSSNGDRVRVVVGEYGGVTSPLAPAEPFTFLAVDMCCGITFDLQESHTALVYVVAGDVLIHTEDSERMISADHALALHGGSGRVTFGAVQPARFFILSGAAIHEPVVLGGTFIMNERWQIADALARFRAGQMGKLAPLPGQ